MKKTVYYLCIAALLSCIVVLNTSCSEKTQAISDLEELAEDVQENGNTYGISEWKDVFQQYQEITKIIDKHRGDYSQKQRNRINHAKSTIKQAAWDSLNNSLDIFGLKKFLQDLYNSYFPNTNEDPEGTE